MNQSGKPWFEQCPELLTWELKRFEEWEIDVEVDPSHRQQGRLVVRFEKEMAGAPVPIEVRYPSEYPELPPVISGPPGLMERHQHRFGGNFCLLARPLDDWQAGTWGAADLVGERLQALFRDTEAGPAAVRAAEEPMPEPVSAYYATASDATVLLPDATRPGGDRGELTVRRCTPYLFLAIDNGTERLSNEVAELFPASNELIAPWVRLTTAPPAGPDGAAVAHWLRKEHPDLLARELPPRLRNSKHLPAPPAIELCCLVFPEEGPEVGEIHDGYLFLCIQRDPAGNRHETLLSVQRLSAGERARRAPELTGLEDKRVLIVGLGTVGGDVALELAKAGLGRLDLLDFDSLEFGNLLRHRLGLEYLGLPKARGVALAARRANPFCITSALELQLGSIGWDEESPFSQLEAAVETADLVIDASGSHQIAQLVSRVCSQQTKPMVAGWLTEGFYGAEVVRLYPGRTMCWTCFVTAQRKGSLLTADSGPPSQVAALGCSHPTTTGAGFDAAETASVVARLAVQTFAPSGGYPACEWDHAVINFRRAFNDGLESRFAAEALPPREECEVCAVSAGFVRTP